MSSTKRAVIFLFSIAIIMLTMVACDANSRETSTLTPSDLSSDSEVDTSTASDVVEDFSTSEAELHEPILPMEFEDGEDVDNPYYKRTVDENGKPAYLVTNGTTGQPQYLPMGQTVIYSGDYEDCFYERYTITYKINGEYRSMVQYQLYVNAESVPLATVEPRNEVDAGTDTPIDVIGLPQ